MAGNMYGADSEELERIATEIEGYEKELDYLLVQGVGAVSLVGLSATLGTIWRGPRSDEFGAIWQSRHLLRLRDVQGLLQEAAQDLRKNACEQRSASSILGPLPGPRGPNIGNPPDIDLRLLYPGIGLGPLFPGYPGSRPPWEPIGPLEALKEGWDVVKHMDDLNTLHEVFTGSPISEAFDKAGPVIGMVGVGIDAFEATDAWINDGFTAGTVWETVETGWGAAGVVYPPAAWTKAAFETGVWIGDTAYHHTPLGDYLEHSHPATASIDRAMDFGIHADQMVATGQFDEANELNRQAMEAAKEARRQSEGWRGVANATRTVFTLGLW